MKRPILVLGFGNPGRLDDGLVPALAERVEQAGLEGVVAQTEYQLNIEHASDVASSGIVIFGEALSGPALRNLDCASAMLVDALRSDRPLDQFSTDAPIADTLAPRNGGEPCRTASP